jgi:hypothetical protein
MKTKWMTAKIAKTATTAIIITMVDKNSVVIIICSGAY